VTQLEVAALLDRVDARRLREEAGIRMQTVAWALGLSESAVRRLETGRRQPRGAGSWRWARFTAALERRAEITAEVEAAMAAGELADEDEAPSLAA
jgi:transcriptional regulator with XRE-family HTH domain